MKKLLSILVCALAICGCGKTKVKPFELEDKYYGEGKFIQVTEANQLKTLENDKESYIVYIYLGGCLICQAFKPKVREVISEKGLIVYEAPIEFLKEANSVIVFERPNVRFCLNLHKKRIFCLLLCSIELMI